MAVGESVNPRIDTRFAVTQKVKAAVAYTGTILFSIAALVWVLKLWRADFSIPFVYSNDSLVVGTLIKGVIDNGWCLHNNYLGAPAGQNMLDFPMADNLHFLLIKSISMFTQDWAQVINVYFLATFPLTALSATFVYRRFDISFPVAALGALLFAFLPYHILRGEEHLFLAAIFMIPLSCLAVIKICSAQALFLEHTGQGTEKFNLWTWPAAGYAVIALLTGSAGIYYAFFAIFFAIIAGAYAGFSCKSWRRPAAAAIFTGLIVVALLVNLMPSLIYQHKNGRNQEAAKRSPNETLAYGLTISSLVFPVPGHRIAILKELTDKAMRKSEPAPWAASLGIFGGTGFVFLCGWLLFAKGKKWRHAGIGETLDILSVLNMAAILLAVAGGVSLVLALLVTPQLRAYNRIGIYTGFFSVTAMLLVLEALRQKKFAAGNRGYIFAGAMTCILLLGILDQTSNIMIPDYSNVKKTFASDDDFVEKTEAVMPVGALIFQLPHVAFPESPVVNKMVDYEQFRPYLHSHSLRWSYGAMKGRDDSWQKKVAAEPVNEMLTDLRDAGFSGIYINRAGYSDGATAIASQLENALKKKPEISGDNSLLFFNLTTPDNRQNLP